MREARAELTPRYARFLIRLLRPLPDFDVAFMRPLRREAVRKLDLKPGDRVLDAGCGMGGSFPYLVDAIGPSGEVVGVEISPEMAINARRRVEKNNGQNVRVVEADARAVPPVGMFDGLLMFAAPNVYAPEDALANIFPHLKDDARIVLFGAKTSEAFMGKLLNPLLRFACSKLSFPTTPVPDSEPWRMVARHVGKLEIEPHFFGGMFLASGSYIGMPGKMASSGS